ncbi:gamma-glutamyl-gamma-aminobutyrate hydrolase family protein [Schnuerera sp. xch1]|uniref:gamma-glutamyl-gamma-aminobutyrate hydrolase family protein n=1 Tax=Schnuerera sp. xch1 TaxID=2874283 RepID=UPI001CBEAEDB|nr:gamma-glutamyl-gamma-aminobutyrate hydrolase family protein [Schnuerera sp. xch1]MBZ2174360.1 gamma-glutamyl-gamma-aminobutyrate hydrolase family protein [Schnuerera sp. xch1]
MKPIIGILATNCEGTQGEYIKAIEKAGGCPVVLSEVENISTINPINQILDGIVFTGGTDISPLNYEEMPYMELGLVDPIRDKFEINLAKKILLDTDIPILGICRGMQILNVAAGGSLYQDLLGQKVTEFNHSLTNIFPKDEPSHMANINRFSKLHAIFSVDKIAVNSFHHQGIKVMGEDFEATMTSEDNIVEAIEMKGERFVVGVQWHPEMLLEEYPEYLKLFTSFVGYCQKIESKV